MKTEELKNIIKESITREIKNAILEGISEEVYIIKNKEGEPIEQFETQEEAEKALETYKKNHPDQELIIEPGKKMSFDDLDTMSEKLESMKNMNESTHKGHFTMEQVLKLAKKAGKVVLDAQDALEELCEMYGDKIPASRVFEILDDYDMPELKSKIKVKKVEPKEGNAFTGALDKAKDAGEDSFTVGGKKFEVKEDWGSSDQSIMNKSIHKDLGEPETFPFDLDSVLSAAESAVDFYWNEWPEYEEDRDSLIQHAAQKYYRAYFPETFSQMQAMFAPKSDDSEGEQNEGNAFTAALTKAKEAGEEKFTVDGKEYDVEECWNKQMEEEEECAECGDNKMEEEEVSEGTCDKCGKEICECGTMMNESKKSIRLTESDLVELIKKMVNEAVPGIETYQKAHKESGSENDEALSDVEKKIKDYLNFDGNDNPEFPHQVGGDVEARRADDEESEEVADHRGGGLEDLIYDVDPSEEAQERHKKALTGDSTMGNSHDAANVIPSKLGEKIIKKVKRKDKQEENMPMYNKDVQPVKAVNEAEEGSTKVISEEIERMKQMASYNKKTQ